ncbi:MAG: DUF1580 domain-containing protein [Planctomycetes bacterium]|nr:DUF1580 domain-containing protein [Planctomycetota bacterium]
MINLQQEHILTFREAASKLPRRRAGRNCSISTLHRWRLKGVRGVRLETGMLGGIRVTSAEAIQRFMDRITGESEDKAAQPIRETSALQERELAKVETELEKEGF